jgi:hypothetical protein
MLPSDAKLRGVVDALAARVDGLTRTFVTHGSETRSRPIRIRFNDLNDGTTVVFPMREVEPRELQPLLARLAPAPVGKGSETVVDPAVREALSAKAAGLFRVDGLELGDVLAQVAAELMPDAAGPPVAECSTSTSTGPAGTSSRTRTRRAGPTWSPRW